MLKLAYSLLTAGLLIDGKYLPSSGDETLETIDPSTIGCEKDPAALANYTAIRSISARVVLS